MGFSLGELLFSLKADTAQLRTDMQQAKEVVGEAAGRIAESAEYATKALEFFGVALGAHEFYEFVKGSIEVADQANKAAQKIGITTEALTGLQYAANLADVSNEEFTASLVKFNKAIDGSNQGVKAKAQSFEDLGIATKNVDGTVKDTGEVLLAVAEKFSGLQDGAAKTAISLELFGKAGAQMIPFLNQGRDGIEVLQQKAAELGVTISTETAQSAEEFNDRLRTLSEEGHGFANQLSAEMLPSLNHIAQAFIDIKTNSSAAESFGSGLIVALKSIVSAGSTVVATFRDIGDFLGATAAATVQFSQGAGNALIAFGQAATGAYDDAVKSATAAGNSFSASYQTLSDSSDESRKIVEENDAFIKKIWSEEGLSAEEKSEKVRVVLERETEAHRKAQEEAEKKAQTQFNANQKIVEGLQAQAAALGEVGGTAEIFKLKMNGATDAQIALAVAAVRAKAAFEAQQSTLVQSSADFEAFTALRMGAQTEEEAAVTRLFDKYSQLDVIVSRHPEIAAQASDVRAKLQNQALADQDKKMEAQLKSQQAERDSALQHRAQMGDSEAEWEIKKRQFAELNAAGKTKYVLNQATQLTAGVAQQNRLMFEANKAASTASAIVNTYEMAVGAYKAMASIPYVGPALGIAAAAAAIAFGMAQVSAIQSASFTGGGGGTTPSAAGSAPTINGTPVPSSTSASSNGAQAVPTTTIEIHGDIYSNDAERLLKDLKSLINNGDHVLIENTSRNAQELKAA